MEPDQGGQAELLGRSLNPTSAFSLAYFVTYFPVCFAVVSGQGTVLLQIKQKCQGLAYLPDLDADASCAHVMMFPPQQDVERTQRQVPLKEWVLTCSNSSDFQDRWWAGDGSPGLR